MFFMKPFATLVILMYESTLISPETRETMDKQSFTQGVEQCSRMLYRVAMSYTGNPSDAADAVQEALLRAWNRRDTLRNEQYFATWLTRVLINECKTLIRKRRRMIPAAYPAESVSPPPDAYRPVFEALMRLDAKYRVPLILHVLEGYSIRDVASMMHLSPGTVKTRIFRARTKLEKEVLCDETRNA